MEALGIFPSRRKIDFLTFCRLGPEVTFCRLGPEGGVSLARRLAILSTGIVDWRAGMLRQLGSIIGHVAMVHGGEL